MTKPEGRSRKWVALAVALLLCLGTALAAKTCTSCGTENPDEARFCKKCGARLPAAQARPVTPKLDGTVQVSAGVVTIGSQPPDADVVIDGRPRGKTPLQVSDLGVGRHSVRLSRAGYRDYETTFNVSGQFGTVVVTSDPVGAEVLVDGVVRGNTSDDGLSVPRLLYGKHVIAARLEGYRDVTKELELKSAGPVPLNFKLGWGKGFLDVRSEPTGAEVTRDEQPAGRTPVFAEMEPSRYLLKLSQRGFHEWVGYAQVQYAETVRVLAQMERIRVRRWPLLAVSLAGAAGAGFAAYRGESEYSKYRAATTPEQTEELKASVEKWDLYRNAAAGLAVLGTGLFVTIKW